MKALVPEDPRCLAGHAIIATASPLLTFNGGEVKSKEFVRDPMMACTFEGCDAGVDRETAARITGLIESWCARPMLLTADDVSAEPLVCPICQTPVPEHDRSCPRAA